MEIKEHVLQIDEDLDQDESGNYWEPAPIFKRSVASAVCTSKHCRKHRIKNVAKTSDWCPDCGSALFWQNSKVKVVN